MNLDTAPFLNRQTEGGDFEVFDERTGEVLAAGLTEQRSWQRMTELFDGYLTKQAREKEAHAIAAAEPTQS